MYHDVRLYKHKDRIENTRTIVRNISTPDYKNNNEYVYSPISNAVQWMPSIPFSTDSHWLMRVKQIVYILTWEFPQLVINIYSTIPKYWED